jgi:hypothetical protein
VLLCALQADDALSVFLALRRLRVNHKYASRAILRYLANHPSLEALAVFRRPAVRDVLEHALGRNVARGCFKSIEAGTDVGADYARRHLLKFAQDRSRLADVVRYLYGRGDALAGRTVDKAALDAAPARIDARLDRPRTVTATNRGDISAALVHLYRSGEAPYARRALEQHVDAACTALPRFDGTVSVILDASASMRGYGEREFAAVSQAQALRLVLERCCGRLNVLPVGGGGPADLPVPRGDTDLAGAVLDAAREPADLLVIVSDGYENVAGGDLARVIGSLPRAGVGVPVVFVHVTFTAGDDLSLRRPAPGIPELAVWHQDEFADVLLMLFSYAMKGDGSAVLRRYLRDRLARLETEVRPWLSPTMTAI